jgi:hypothetical protein
LAVPVSVRREANAPADYAHKKGLQMQAFSEAAEGIRTLDLLHGNRLGNPHKALSSAVFA